MPLMTRRDALAGAALLPFAARGAQAQTTQDEALIAAARKEGSVLWYTTLIVNQAVLPLKAAFEKKYPGVTLQFVRNDEAPTAIRLMNEMKGGRPQADVFDGLSIMATLRRAGLLAAYSPPTSARFPAEMKDKDGFWTAILLYVFAPGVNTSMVPPNERPTSYDDLLKPRWKGRMAWNPNSVAGAIGFVGATLLSRGEAEGMRYLEALSKQDIVNIEASSRAILDQVIAGEYPLGLMCFNNHTVISAAKGAPSDWLRIAPAPVAFDAVSLLKDAPHPNAARLLINFLTSEDGQNVLRKANYIPAMNGIEALSPDLKPANAGLKATYLYPSEIDENLARWQGVVQKLFKR